MGKVNNKDGMFVDCWLDDENISEKAFLLLRKLVVIHHSKEELLGYLMGSDTLRGQKRKKETEEIQAWADRCIIDAARIKEENLKKLRECQESEEKEIKERKKEEKPSKRFSFFMTRLRDLCGMCRLSMSTDWDGNIIISDLKEDYSPFDISLFEDETTW